MFSGLLGGVVQGMAFGTGSAVAHRAVDAVAGPRQVEHVHTDQNAPNTAAAAGAPAAASGSSYDEADRTVCKDDFAQFQQCMAQKNNQIDQCNFLYNILNSCRKSAAENQNWQ
jgi:hypothetical protein